MSPSGRSLSIPLASHKRRAGLCPAPPRSSSPLVVAVAKCAQASGLSGVSGEHTGCVVQEKRLPRLGSMSGLAARARTPWARRGPSPHRATDRENVGSFAVLEQAKGECSRNRLAVSCDSAADSAKLKLTRSSARRTCFDGSRGQFQ